MRSKVDFEEFALARTPHLFRTAWLLCADHHLAEDLVQETLARMFLAWRGLDRVENPSAYAQTVLVRTFISQRRKRSSTERPTETVPEKMANEGDQTLRMALQSALSELSPQDRAVLVLRFFEDRSVEQVARDLGTSSNAVRSRTSRALNRIRTVFGADLAHLALS
ncbi:SigE family RNA polymerase sigma factor [Tenggerimyces flavus]|uniref:SigE family RNA polymerase sigma factor n=1 Tax=Tenggerimyces flavus TaxID=1708749 RepID=A0ABV7Y4A5_9ACTN|nr:SigE family RNA polymerase sigma factor [Tenggerimyces flavus]MBM7788365.1 RNA polymerase sigma-70 factor (sigma-E family) [Tenggerimyces flavus]